MPDYRNRFLVSAGNKYSVGSTGGSDAVTLSESQMPRHSHGISYLVTSPTLLDDIAVSDNVGVMGMTIRGNVIQDWFFYTTGEKDPNATDGYRYKYSTDGEKSDLTIYYMSTTSNVSGSGQSHENRPPYIAVKWMIKAK